MDPNSTEINAESASTLAELFGTISTHKLEASILLIAVLLLVRWLVVKYLRKRLSEDNEQPRRLINTVNNTTTLLITLGVIIVWVAELRFVALSIATFVVALVIATREFIQCFLGSIYLTGARLFSVGDWIQVGDRCGEVVRSDWISTTLLEVDLHTSSYVYTGRTLVIPNNQMIIVPVINLNFMRRYVAHSFDLVREPDQVNICEAKAFMLEKAQQYCSSFRQVAERYNHLIEKRLGTQIAGPDASVRITTNNLGKNVMTITVFCPTQEAINIEQQLTEDFMSFWYQQLRQLGTDGKHH